MGNQNNTMTTERLNFIKSSTVIQINNDLARILSPGVTKIAQYKKLQYASVLASVASKLHYIDTYEEFCSLCEVKKAAEVALRAKK